VVGTAFYLNHNFESIWLGVAYFKNFEIFFLLQIIFFLAIFELF